MSGRRPRSLACLRAAGALALCGVALGVGCGSASAPDGTRLVLLLTVDTLRADRLGAHGSDEGLTPTLDRLAAESVVFSRAYTPVPHTLPAVAALLTGRYPQTFGVTGNLSALPGDVAVLADAFRAAGWNTAAVVSNWVLRGAVGTARGFDHFDDRMSDAEAARPMPERGGAATTRDALAAADACLPSPAARCLLWVHYQDPHGPYTPPAALRAERLAIESAREGGERELPLLPGSFGAGGIPDYQVVDGEQRVAFYRAGYDAEIAHLDGAIDALLAGLASRVPSARTAIVFAADHGEALGEEDFWFGHGETLEEHQVHVPLWFRLPGMAPARRDDLASLLDVHPTLTRRFLGEMPGTTTGRDLFGDAREPRSLYLATLQGSAAPHIGVIEADWKYRATLRDERDWDGRLSRLGNDAVDLTAPAPQVAARLRTRLEELLQAHPAIEGERLPLDPGDRERLRALGYLREDAH